MNIIIWQLFNLFGKTEKKPDNNLNIQKKMITLEQSTSFVVCENDFPFNSTNFGKNKLFIYFYVALNENNRNFVALIDFFKFK